jgi:ADP-heptose:LPS heptosyltransferase
MGSMVLAQPMVGYLKERYPAADLHVVQLGKNQEIVRLLGFANPRHMHAIDDSSLFKLLASLYRVIRDLRRAGVDAVIDCELFARISSCIAYLTGASRLAGFTKHTQEGLYRGNFINCALPYNPYRSIKDQFISLARALEKPHGVAGVMPRSRHKACASQADIGFSSDRRFDALPPLALKDGELAAAVSKLQNKFPPLGNKPLVLLYPGGGILPIRAWPEDYFATTAKALLDAGCAVGFIGLPVDKPLAQSLVAKLQTESTGASAQQTAVLDLTGYTKSIRELLVLFFHAKLLITNDGGPGHFAALTPINTIMFFGPETPTLYAPLVSSLGGESVALFAGTPCSPCLTAYNHRTSSCDGDNLCLQEITPAQVLRHASTMLGLTIKDMP